MDSVVTKVAALFLRVFTSIKEINFKMNNKFEKYFTNVDLKEIESIIKNNR